MKYKFFSKYINKNQTYNNYDDFLFFEQNDWDDFGFKTLFEVYYPQKSGKIKRLGSIHIAELNANNDKPYSTFDKFETENDYDSLPKDFISLGNEEFYLNLHKVFERKECLKILEDLRDICISYNEKKKSILKKEVVKTSFFRGRSSNLQHRIEYILKPLADKGYRENYNLTYTYSLADELVTKIDFISESNSIFPQNVHAIIGKNGAGKTTFIKDILSLSINPVAKVASHFKIDEKHLHISFSTETGIKINNLNDYFSKTILISFSPFDNLYLNNGKDIEGNKTLFDQNPNIKYLGLYKKNNVAINFEDQFNLFWSLIDQLRGNEDNWKFFKEILENQDYQGDINSILNKINEVTVKDTFRNDLEIVFQRMSAGQKIILLSIAMLIIEVEQFSLVLIDEPELFLHPPMISNYIRSISEIMRKKNGLCILTTHSPIIIQEIPQDCVKIIDSDANGQIKMIKPPFETLGENLSTLTNTIFELDQYETGFYKLITKLKNDLDEGEIDYNEFEKLKFGRDGMLYKDLLLSELIESEED